MKGAYPAHQRYYPNYRKTQFRGQGRRGRTRPPWNREDNFLGQPQHLRNLEKWGYTGTKRRWNK